MATQTVQRPRPKRLIVKIPLRVLNGCLLHGNALGSVVLRNSLKRGGINPDEAVLWEITPDPGDPERCAIEVRSIFRCEP